MYKLKIYIVLLVLFPSISWAQSITGVVLDPDSKSLELATVSLVNPKDSILVSYSSTDKNGKFNLENISKGKLLLQIHFVGFRTYQKVIEYKGEAINLGSISLENSNELDEVIVTAIVPITVKEDTVSYNTKAFKVRVDDNVEDLLKKMPGVEIDASGKITAQGESVGKIYVDGKEFFSGDPTIATKNLSADAIKSIEIIDEKSEKSRVSGVNDSAPKKVINLKLKDDKKVNDFGKIQGGYGTDDRYLTSLNYNRFSSKLQTSIIGKYNNINTSGSDISEIMNFNSGGGTQSGFVTTGIGGLNLGYEFNKKQELNADYFYNHTKSTSGDVYTTRTEFIENQEILTESRSRNENISNGHSANFNYRDRSNKLSSIYVRGSLDKSKSTGKSVNTLDKYNGQGELDLQSIGGTDNESTNSSGSAFLYYTKRFNEKSKRSISTNFGFNASKSKSSNTNNQLNRFNISDINNTFDSKQEIVKDQNLDNASTNLSFEYTEPISNNHLIEFVGDVSYKTTDDDVNQTKLENDVVQNPLIYNQYYRGTELKGGVLYKYDTKKHAFSTGVKFVDQTQRFGLENDKEYNNRYTNINPQLSFRYRPKRGTFMRISLGKSVNLPNLSRLSPVLNDFNPLYLKKGNPYLTPEDKYSVNAMFGKFNHASGFRLFTNFGYNYTNNNIVNSETTDVYGVRTTTYENYGDKNNANLSFRFGNRIKTWGIRYSINLRGSYSEYLSIINDENNETQSKDGSFGFSLENNEKEKFDAMIGADWKKNYTIFTSGDNADRDYFQQSYYVKLDWNITDRLNINSQFKYDIYTDSNFGTDQTVPIWNGSISYALLESRRLNLMISALDILNKNIGIVRNSSDNYFEETTKEVLGNYYMFSVTYNLNGNKNKGGKQSSKRSRRVM